MAATIGLYFGSSTGATERVSYIIKEVIEATGLATVSINVVAVGSVKSMEQYDYLMFGCPTWNIGELQDDWALVFPVLDSVSFSGRKVSFFGTGDQYGYSNSFVDAIGILCEKVDDLGGEVVGWWPVDDKFEFEYSRGAFENIFMGLAVDEDSQANLTRQRVVDWAYWVLEEYGLYQPADKVAA
jgi:flavodoxin I